MDYRALGKRVRSQRKLMGLTQEDLSEKVGISCSFMGHIERGTRKLSVDTLVKLSEALNLSCDALLQDSLDSDVKREAEGMSDNKKRLLNEIASVLRENDV